LEYGNIRDDAPATRELIVDADIEKELVIFDLIVKELTLCLSSVPMKCRKELNSRKPTVTVRRRSHAGS